VAVSLNRIGDALKASGDFSGALTAYQEDLEISRKLAEKDKDNLERQFDVAVMLDRIGDVLTAKGDLAGATAAYSELLSICRALAAKDPGNTNWQQSLAVSLEKVAAGLKSQEDLQGALAAYREDVDIRRKLVAKDKENAQWQRDLSVTLNKIGDLLVAQTLGSWSKYEAWSIDKRADLTQSDLGPVLTAYQESLAIDRKLAAKDERNTQWQLDLSIDLDRAGDLLAAKGDVSSALERYRESLDIRRKLVAKDEHNAEWQAALAGSLATLGQAGVDPLKNGTEALAILKKLQSEGRLRAVYVGWIENIEADLAKLNQPEPTQPPVNPPAPTPVESAITGGR
jgi:tetratricopeptide (TPR) repeat protein